MPEKIATQQTTPEVTALPLPFSPQQLDGLADLCRQHKVATLSYAGDSPIGPNLLVEFLPEGRRPWHAEYYNLAESIESMLDQSIFLTSVVSHRHTAKVLNLDPTLPASQSIYHHAH